MQPIAKRDFACEARPRQPRQFLPAATPFRPMWLQRTDLAAAPPVTICNGFPTRGAAWSHDGQIG